MPCEFYERLAAGPLGRLLVEKGDRFFKAVKLLVGAVPPLSSLVETVEVAVDLFRRGLAGELVELLKAARATGQCDEEAKRAAERLGVSEEWLRTLAQNLVSLPEIDLSQLEERARALERGLELLKRLSPHIIDLGKVFVEEGGRLFVNSPFGVVEYVEVGIEGRVREALSRGRVAVVYGPRGVGKSTTALKAMYDFAKAQPDRAVVVLRVGEDWKEALWAVAQLRGGPFVPVLYYDTLEAGGYKRSEEGVKVRYSAMAQAKPLAEFLHDATLLRVPTVVVLAEEDYRAYEDAFKRVGAEALRLGGEAEALVRGILRSVPYAVADAILERYSGEFYAVVAALAKALYEEWRDQAKVVDAVKRLDVHRFALDYIWRVVLGEDEYVARWAAPLVLATGFFGPHPPKLGEAVAVAMSHVVEGIFGAGSVKRYDYVLKWLTSPLYGTLYETIRRVAHGAVYRRFGIGSDDLCQGSVEGPCHLVKICTEALVGVPRRRYSGVEEVAEEYAKLVAERLKAPGPAGVRQIDLLIDDFLQAFNGVVEDGRWRIRYETKGSEGVKLVENVVDELDILSALYGVAVLPGWYPELKPLEEWLFIGDKKVGAIRRYLFFLLREKGRVLVKRAVAIVYKAERRGFYTDIDLWRAVGIVTAGQWDTASDEELENALKLAANALLRFVTFSPIILEIARPLLSETWRRVVSRGMHKDMERRQRLADWLTVVAGNVAIGFPLGLPLFFTVRIDKLDLEAAVQHIMALYNAASNVGKLLLLDTLLYTSSWDISGINVAAMLLGQPQLEQWRAFEEVAKRVEEFVSSLDGVEKAYAVARLYPRLARLYASSSEFDEAVKFVYGALKALKELWGAYERDKASTEEKLRPYLELRQVKPGLGKELNKLSWYVYHYVARVYIDSDELDKAVEYAEEACVLAKKLGDVYYEVLSCGLLSRLNAVKGGAPPAEKFEKVWQRASQAVERLGAEGIAATLGEYVVALASVGRLVEVEKVLEKWGWALELYPLASALTYGVLSLFDGQYLEKAVGHLPEWARANLPKLADVLHDAVEAGVSSEESKIVVSARETLTVVYGRDVVEALLELASRSDKLFLATLVGLAYCKRGEEWGLKVAKEVVWSGSQLFKGITGRLFGELAKALERAMVGNCVTDEVLRAVYKLYYAHV